MWQVNYCPRCGGRIMYGDRFCGNCGVSLVNVMQQMTPQPQPVYQSYQYAYPRRQQYSPAYSQTVATGSSQSQEPYTSRNDSNATPISDEIAKLLVELFDKRMQQSQT